MSGIEILLGDNRGIYIPQNFADGFDGWSGINIEDLEILEKGPEEECYWEAWDCVLRDAFYVDKEGHNWRLYQDGDLFAICDELMTNEEYKDFFGEERS